MYKIDPDYNLDRFDISRFMQPVTGEAIAYFDIVDSEFLKNLMAIKVVGTYFVSKEEGRPDLLSERIYGTGNTQYWWILMLFNDLRLPSDLKRNTTVRYPTLSDLETLLVSLTPQGNNLRGKTGKIFEKFQTTKSERLL